MLQNLGITDDFANLNNHNGTQELLVKADCGRCVAFQCSKRISTTSLVSDESHINIMASLEPFVLPKSNVEASPQDIQKRVTQALDAVEQLKQSASSFEAELESPIDIFIPFAYKDQRLLAKIEKRLRILVRQGWNIAWVSSEVAIEMGWQDKSLDDLERYDLILLLVTPEFIETEYCYSLQLKHAVERHTQSKAYVLPIIFYASVFPLLDGTPFAKLPKTPKGGKAVNEWQKSDLAYKSITEDILEALRNLRGRL